MIKQQSKKILPYRRIRQRQNPSKCKRSSGVPSLDGTPELLYFIFPCVLYLFSNPVDLHCRRLLSAGTASASSEESHFTWGLQTRAVPAGVSRLSFESTRYENGFNMLVLVNKKDTFR